MRGHVYKRGSTWTAVHEEPSVDGERRQRSKGGFATRRAAEQYLSKTLTALGDGIYVPPESITLREYLESEWLPAIERTVRPLTFDTYRSIVRAKLVPRIGSVRLQALSPAQVNRLHADLERDGLSIASRRLTHAVLGRACRDALRWGRLPRNPVALADPPGLPERRVECWSARELGRFLEHVRGERLYPLWRLASTSGMRRGELAGLCWRSLDLDAGSLVVEQQIIETRDGLTFGPPKSRRSRRSIALDADTADVLRDHRSAQEAERALAGPAYQDRDLVFADELGGPIRPRRLTERFERHRKAAGISVGTLHVLRHSAATLALSAGVPVHVVAGRLGDDPAIVLRTYAHLLPQSDRAAAESIAGQIPLTIKR